MIYKVLSAATISDLQKSVNEHLAKGFQPQGGLVVEPSGPPAPNAPFVLQPPGPTTFHQAVAKMMAQVAQTPSAPRAGRK